MFFKFLSKNSFVFKNLIRGIASKSAVHEALDVRKDIVLNGWVSAIRKHKEVIFIDITDGRSARKIQAVLHQDNKPDALSYGSSVQVEGAVTESSGSRQNVEIVVSSIKVLGECDQEKYPFRPKKRFEPDYTRQLFHLRPRLSSFAALMRIRHLLRTAIDDSFRDRGFFHVDTPILTSNDCEGAGEVFTVQPATKMEGEFFGKKTFLTVSSQLHLEAAAQALSRVYTTGKTFRAENANTRRHLCEFTMIEAEEAFVNSLQDLVDSVESLLRDVIVRVVDKCDEEFDVIRKNADNPKALEAHFEALRRVADKPFIRLSYDEALSVLRENSSKFKTKSSFEFGSDLGTEHEEFLVRHLSGSELRPIFVTRYPTALRPFYMKRTDSGTVECFDLLVPFGGELVGGSIREERYDVMKQRLDEIGQTDSLKWYLELREWGSVPHGGFGLGFDRFVQYLTATRNIKDAVPFPRWYKHCQC